MNLTAEQLDQVREMAARLIHPELIARAIGIEPYLFRVLCEDSNEDLHKSYYEGFIQAKIELHESIIKSAKNGSNPSQIEMKKLITESEQYLNG